MTTSAFAQLVDGVATALRTACPGVNVHVNRTRPIGVSELQAVFLRLDSSRRDVAGPLGATDWLTVLQVECAARTTSGQDPAAALDALLSGAWAGLVAVPISHPDVLDVDAEPDISWDFDAGETPLVSATFRLAVRHRTHANSLTPWST